eukprot:1151810-Pelagomonas_calceolata.AAC.9
MPRFAAADSRLSTVLLRAASTELQTHGAKGMGIEEETTQMLIKGPGVKERFPNWQAKSHQSGNKPKSVTSFDPECFVFPCCSLKHTPSMRPFLFVTAMGDNTSTHPMQGIMLCARLQQCIKRSYARTGSTKPASGDVMHSHPASPSWLGSRSACRLLG